MIVHTLKMCTFDQYYIILLRLLNLRHYYIYTIFGVLTLCNLKQFSFLYMQTDCRHIAVVHLLFCAAWIYIYSTFIERIHLFLSATLMRCLLCVICNTNKLPLLLYKLCIHTHPGFILASMSNIQGLFKGF